MVFPGRLRAAGAAAGRQAPGAWPRKWPKKWRASHGIKGDISLYDIYDM